MAKWMLLADYLGKTARAHVQWVGLTVVLENGGPTEHMFNKLANVIMRYPGLKVFAQTLIGGQRATACEPSATIQFAVSLVGEK